MAITKAMLSRCLNEKMQAFCALDKDIQEAMLANRHHGEVLLHTTGIWANKGRVSFDCPGVAYRLSPDTPTEAEWEERAITNGHTDYHLSYGHYGCCVPITESWKTLTDCACHVRFLGIVYVKDGVETLRTSVDAAFGKPVRVRFAKA